MLNIDFGKLVANAQSMVVSDHNFHDEDGTPSSYNADLTPDECLIHKIEFFDKVYTGTPDDIGTIELTYHTRGYRAIYGFTADGVFNLYAD